MLPALRDWRDHPADDFRSHEIGYYVEHARRFEDAGIDALFTADFIGLNRAQLYRGPGKRFEPLTFTAALATHTDALGLITTASTSFTEPYNVARMFRSLENIAPGRTAWNVVTSFSGEQNFGLREIPAPDVRYRRAEEYVEVFDRLWHSWDSDAIVRSAERDVYVDETRVHDIHHHGEFFDVDGAIDIAPHPASPDRPVFFQAGASAPGIDFAARHADAVFVAATTLPAARRITEQLRTRAAELGRDRSALKVFSGAFLTIAPTREQAERLANPPRADEDYWRQLEVVRQEVLGLSPEELGLDDVLPPGWFPTPDAVEASVRRRSRTEVYRAFAERPGQTLRGFLQALHREGPHAHFVGSPADIADEFELWHSSGAVDGFVLITSNDVEPVLNDLLPELRRRGVTKADRRGSSLRENLGLPSRGLRVR